MHRLRFFVLFAAALLAGCDAAGLDDFEEEVAVSVVLTADRPLPIVFLARTGPIGATYDPFERAIRGAEVAISLLAPDGTVEATYLYNDPSVRDDSLGGLYFPADLTALVQAERRYRLEAVVPGFAAPVTAETVVPRAFAVTRSPADTVVFQQGGAPALDVTPSGVEGRPSVYVLKTTALAPSVEAFTPFALDLYLNRDVPLENFTETSSPLLNEGNYVQNSDGTLRIEIPWFAFSFFGPNQVTITALDDALVTFLEFQAIQFIPTTISPGEIPNVPTNVRNGVGVFGAVAQAVDSTFVARP